MNKFIRSITFVLVIGLFSISVFAQKDKMMNIKVYFTDTNDNPNMEDCGKVKAVARAVPKTKAVARAALNELFKGPTEKENKAGLFSFFSDESKHILKSVKIKNGNAYVNLDKWVMENMGNATTSCGGASFISEMNTTLRQFPTIKRVFYSIEKNPADFYEWMQGECPEELKNCDNSNF